MTLPQIRELDKGPSSVPGRAFTFVVDATRCGWGDATVDVTQGGRSLPSKSLEIDRGLYEVTFTPLEAAKHKIYAYFNGHEVKGEWEGSTRKSLGLDGEGRS